MPRSLAASTLSTRDAIVQSACELAKDEGVFGISVDRVIERAGISKGGFFHHFPSKQALVLAVVAAELDRFEALVARYRGAGGSFADALVRALLDFLQSNATMMASVNAALSFGGEVRELVVARRERWRAELRKEVKPAARADLLGHAVDGVIFSCSMRPGSVSRADLAAIRRALQFALGAAE